MIFIGDKVKVTSTTRLYGSYSEFFEYNNIADTWRIRYAQYKRPIEDTICIIVGTGHHPGGNEIFVLYDESLNRVYLMDNENDELVVISKKLTPDSFYKAITSE